MLPLAGQNLLHVWESALHQHPLDRALTILAAVFPAITWEDLAQLPIGQRDALLFAVREQSFGPQPQALMVCPACHEKLEYTVDLPALRADHVIDETEPPWQMSADGYELRFRLPTSLDLAAIVDLADVMAARGVLLQRCVVEAMRDSVVVPVGTLPEPAIAGLAAEMARRASPADVELDLICPACGERPQVLFDIETFLWADISARARRLLYDVHALATAYGWREADILQMSPARRQAYLAMVS